MRYCRAAFIPCLSTRPASWLVLNHCAESDELFVKTRQKRRDLQETRLRVEPRAKTCTFPALGVAAFALAVWTSPAGSCRARLKRADASDCIGPLKELTATGHYQAKLNKMPEGVPFIHVEEEFGRK